MPASQALGLECLVLKSVYLKVNKAIQSYGLLGMHEFSVLYLRYLTRTSYNASETGTEGSFIGAGTS